jgi:hypothetical protein
MVIKDIEVIPLNMRYKPELEECILRSGLLASKGRVTLYRVELEGGAVGYGDTSGDSDPVSTYLGQNAITALTQIRHDDGSPDFAALYSRCEVAPVLTGP